jgi:L-ascorbate metabolism protein UlaG (beta-lactamase superfamily)
MLSRRSLLGSTLALAAGGVAACGACAHESDAVAYRTVSERRAVDGFVHVGNSTHLFVLDGVHVLTDPWVRDPADTITHHRVPPAPLPVAVDVVLVTHAHEDHFDPAALALVQQTSPRAIVVVPAWLVERTRALGFADVRALKAGERLSGDHAPHGLEVSAVHGKHQVDEIVYVFGKPGRSIFWAGDSLRTPEIDAIPRADLCVLPADAGSLMGTRYVMNRDDAVALATKLAGAHGPRAILSHHEYELTSPVYGAIAHVDVVDTAKLPAWFRAPKPGDAFSFPWMESA